MSSSKRTLSPESDLATGGQPHQQTRGQGYSQAKRTSAAAVRGSSVCPSESSCSTSSSQSGQRLSIPLERHLYALDDPINARMNDPRRWKGISYSANPMGNTKPYFPRIVGASTPEDETVSEQDLLLAEVGATLNG